MVFRERVLKHASGSVNYGPFPIRKARLAGSLGMLLVGVPMALYALEHDHVVCTPTASCVVTHAILSETRAFPMAALRDARVDIEQGSKGNEYGVVVLFVDGERDVRLQRVSLERAAEVAETFRASVAAQQPIDVTLRRSWWTFPLVLGLLAMGITMAYSALKGLGRFRLDVTQGGAALRVRRYILGVPVSSHDVSLEGVTDVRVESGALGEMWLSKEEAPSPAARVVLVDRFGAGRPLTATAFPGEAVHLRAAADLLAILELDRERGDVESQLASLQRITTPLGMRIAFAWIGVAAGSLVGMALVGIADVALGFFPGRGPEAWHLAVGGGSGAVAGAALVFYFTRSRPPR